MPALSRRAGDIPALVAEWERQQRPATRVEPTVVAELTKHSWDEGNVRQLFDALTCARQRSDGRHITPTTLDTALTRNAHRRLNHLEQVEGDAIAELLCASGGRRSEVATELGISRATLYRKLSALGLGDSRYSTPVIEVNSTCAALTESPGLAHLPYHLRADCSLVCNHRHWTGPQQPARATPDADALIECDCGSKQLEFSPAHL